MAFVLKNLTGYSVEVMFYEIHGKKCYDLLNKRKLVYLRSDEHEVVHVRGAKSVVSLAIPEKFECSKNTNNQKRNKEDNDDDNLNDDDDTDDENYRKEKIDGIEATSTKKDGKENFDSFEKIKTTSPDKMYVDYPTLVQMLQEALTLRSSEVTERNPVSSRSHAICVIKLLGPSDHKDKNINKNEKDRSMYDEDSHNKTNDNNENNRPPKNPSDTSSNSYPDVPSDGSNVSQEKYKTTVSDSQYYGKITLVDLAGSERNNDTQKMTAVQHRYYFYPYIDFITYDIS